MQRRESIPDHLIEEILLHLPPKSLLRFKTLSKSWESTISSPFFIRAHLRKNENEPPLIVSIHDEISSLVGKDAARIGELTPEEQLKIQHMLDFKEFLLLESGCDGFLLFATYSEDKVVLLWNPSTRKHKILTVPAVPIVQDEKNADVRFEIGYDPSIDNYKIIRLVNSDFQVFTLKSNQWKPVCYDLPCIMDAAAKPVTMKGVMHWVATLEKKPTIVCFDLASETFSVKEAPVGYKGIFGLMEYQGKPGCFCNYFSPYHVWILEDQTWVRSITITGAFSLPFTSEMDVMPMKLRSSFLPSLTISCSASLITVD